jgi:hypothetical protein
MHACFSFEWLLWNNITVLTSGFYFIIAYTKCILEAVTLCSRAVTPLEGYCRSFHSATSTSGCTTILRGKSIEYVGSTWLIERERCFDFIAKVHLHFAKSERDSTMASKKLTIRSLSIFLLKFQNENSSFDLEMHLKECHVIRCRAGCRSSPVQLVSNA